MRTQTRACIMIDCAAENKGSLLERACAWGPAADTAVGAASAAVSVGCCYFVFSKQ